MGGLRKAGVLFEERVARKSAAREFGNSCMQQLQRLHKGGIPTF
jgi:hypothetical protein